MGCPRLTYHQNPSPLKVVYSAKSRHQKIGANVLYFGARYYDSETSVWLSVDPLSDERLWVSPYSYCQNSPVIRTDPTGALDWIPPNEKGGKWTAEAGDGAWQLYEHRENSASWDEVKQAVKNLNFKRGESNEFMVHPGDKVTLPGSGSNSGESTSSGINYTPTKEHQNLTIPENYDPGGISQYEPTWVDKWSESDNFFTSSSYGIVDGLYVTAQSFIRGPKTQHLNGSQVAGGGAERTDAFVTTVEVGMLAGELRSFRIIKSGIYSGRWGLRIQAHSHSLSPLKGRQATGSMKPFHININNKHIILNPKYWKYYY